ncbi:MAG: addiction module antitoxin RelB [Syntrophus sp. RIFOXYC2_FULL_54_9]|nr:MAG: addiction module antitoxin RelB [Syntrophus sp. GWC2_56_31]OHE30098.1 MAG: addiction module antitoxin RelB [Syntrophus sp. RIFOXYC2_FULL_54_9]HBB16450.1 addiction module antitoxin RelB [Syntrophus sp. (in: bacteria)]
MNLTLPLDQMTISDKLRTIEEIWEDLCRSAEDVPSPSWHADVLCAREDRVNEGSSKYLDWGEAKKNIRDNVK